MKKMANKDLRVKELCKLRGITLEELANRLASLTQAMSRNSFSADECSPSETFLAIIKDGDRCYTAHSVDELQKVTDEIKKSR